LDAPQPALRWSKGLDVCTQPAVPPYHELYFDCEELELRVALIEDSSMRSAIMEWQGFRRRASAAVFAFVLAMVGLPSSYAASQITIVRDSRPAATILLFTRSKNKVAEFAASELSGYIQRISGATLPVVNITVSAPTRLSSALVIVTDPDVQSELAHPAFLNSLLRTVEWSVPSTTAGDGFFLRTLGSNILFAGANDRGTLYAVYRFLETLGVRFYAPEFCFYQGHAEKAPAETTITVAPMSIWEKPSYPYRALDIGECDSCTTSTLTAVVDWMAKNRMNFVAFNIDPSEGLGLAAWDQFRDALTPELQKRGIILEVGEDDVYNKFLPKSVYNSAHPDWFPGTKDPVEGCGYEPPANIFHIANPQALNTLIANGKQYLASRPEIDIFSIWPPDGAKWPASDIEQIGSVPNAPAYVLNPFQDALVPSNDRLQRRIPVSGLSYSCYNDPPSAQYMYDAATMMKFAFYNRSYQVPIFDNSNQTNAYYAGLIPEWRKAGFQGPAFIYEYYSKYSWHSLPFSPVRLIGQEVPYYASFASGMSHYGEPAAWVTYELIHLELAQLMWNKSTDLNPWLQSYLNDRFGRAAGDMAHYFNDVEAAGGDLFTIAAGNYTSLTGVTSARASFLNAKNDLAAAQASTTDAVPLFLTGLLAKNIDFAIADTDISYYQLLGDQTDEAAAQSLTKQLISSYRFDGIILQDYYSMSRYDSTVTWTGLIPSVHQQYASGFAQSCQQGAAPVPLATMTLHDNLHP
jgi:hypothetical protein